MADYNNAVVFYDANGIEYSKQIKKTLERGFERECFLINLDAHENTLSKINSALKTSKYVIFLFSSIYSNEQMLSEAKNAFNSDKQVISLKLNDPSLKQQILIHQPEFEDNYGLSKKVSQEVEKIKKMEIKGPDFIESITSFNMGNIYFNFGKYDEAIRCYKKAVKIMPDFIDALNNFNSLSNTKLSEMEAKRPAIYKDAKIDEIVPDIFSNTAEKPEEIQKCTELEPEELEDLILEGEVGTVAETKIEEEIGDAIDVEMPVEKNLETKIEEEPVEIKELEDIEKIQDEMQEIEELNNETDIIFEGELEEEIETDVEEVVIEISEEIIEDIEILDVIDKFETDFEEIIEDDTSDEIESLEELLDNSKIEEETLDIETITDTGFAEVLTFANALYESGDFNAAEVEYIKAISLNPDYSEAHNNYGCLLEYLERFDEAELEFKKAVELDDLNSKAHNNLATLLAKSEKFDEAEKYYKKAIELDPEYWGAIYNLGAMYATLKRYDEAISQVKSMVKIFRSEGNIKEVLELKKLVKHLKKLKIQNAK
uniref:Tetratricopeptide TPR_2 repeat protein n=1 Tax=Methanococcus maripaludis (strain C6 / ATCC BAA-1332) TaxID=444158 RepID=A9AB70_METM6